VVETAAIKRFPGAVMSQSFGTPEILVHANNAQLMQAHNNYIAAQQAGITVFASAGDFGATNGFSTANAGFPASDPLVTGVGGTEGNPYPAGLSTPAYGGEQVWNEPQFGSATGGSPSLLFGVPAFQNGLGLTSRTVPDIAYNAAIDGGVLVRYSAFGPASFFIVGGTSAGSPQWAAIIALANQLSASQGHGALGYINPALYQLAQSGAYATDFHDIIVGDNQLVGTPVGFSATPGYDAATGWGTPNVAKLVPDLVKTIFP
jgi:subtilase family serine protease